MMLSTATKAMLMMLLRLRTVMSNGFPKSASDVK